MPIAIRNGQRYRIQFSYVGGDYHLTRYEPEHDSARYFYLFDDNVNDLTMGCDGEDALALDRDLEQGANGLLPESEFEAKLKRTFEETLRELEAANGSGEGGTT